MTKKITDLEGRLEAALKRDLDKLVSIKIDVIGKYQKLSRQGMADAEIIFCKVIDEGKIEFVVWDRNNSTGARYHGDYFETFRDGLSRFLNRVEADGGL